MSEIDIIVLVIFIVLFLCLDYKLIKSLKRIEELRKINRKNLEYLINQVRMHGKMTDLDYRSYIYIGITDKAFEDSKEFSEWKDTQEVVENRGGGYHER